MAALGDDALIGRVLDHRYLIDELIARGGMASVFVATDQRLDRVVAVKIMHTGLGDDGQFTERFVREARSAAKLNHSNVVAVFDQGTDGDITYLVMEYVPGKTLRDVFREEAPMTARRALSLMEQVLIALSAAHSANLIHRDIKPENVLMTPKGEIKVADFGLARAVSSATTATGGTLIGTISYLAPEIVVNSGADARSDVYACGAMLYEMLTGLKPHTGDTPIQVAYKHVHEDVAPPSDAIDGIPPYLDALVARVTARDRSKRSADAHVMLQQVRQVMRALDAGIWDDAELIEDLLPISRADESDDREDTAPIRTESTDREATSVIGPMGDLFEDDREATLHWSSGPPSENSGPAEGSSQRSGMHPPMSVDQYKTARGGGRRRGKILLILVVAIAVLAAVIGWYIGVGRYDSTPQLTGSTETQAKAAATKAGFTFKVSERRYSETSPQGTVISTNPKPGDDILPGRTITAVISKGKERYDVPKLKGKSIDEAQDALAKLKLKLGKQTKKYDETIDEGKIIASEVKPGTPVKKNTEIDVIVSKGRQPIDVTNYEGKSQTDATKALEAAGFQVGVEKKYDDDVEKGQVISQDPNSGTKYKGDTITLTVSKGPEAIPVPDVDGKKREEAEKILKKAGFEVEAQGRKKGKVRFQSPSAGDKAKIGSTVTILTF